MLRSASTTSNWSTWAALKPSTPSSFTVTSKPCLVKRVENMRQRASSSSTSKSLAERGGATGATGGTTGIEGRPIS